MSPKYVTTAFIRRLSLITWNIRSLSTMFQHTLLKAKSGSRKSVLCEYLFIIRIIKGYRINAIICQMTWALLDRILFSYSSLIQTHTINVHYFFGIFLALATSFGWDDDHWELGAAEMGKRIHEMTLSILFFLTHITILITSNWFIAHHRDAEQI